MECDLGPEDRELVRGYARDGYAVIDLRTQEFDRIAERIDHALDEPHSSGTNRVQDAWRNVPEVRALAANEKVKRALRTLYSRRPIPFQTLNFRRGTEQRTHSDMVHFNSMPQRFMVGVWVALEDIGPGSGPLHYYPGSHRLAEYLPHEIGLRHADTAARYEDYEDFLARLLEAAELRKETVQPRKGQAFIWAANLLHGGEPITDPESTRRSQVTHYYFEGCRYWTPLNSDPPVGRISWRRVVNVETGDVEPHYYQGKPVRLPLAASLQGAIDARQLAGKPPGRIARAAVRAVDLVSRG